MGEDMIKVSTRKKVMLLWLTLIVITLTWAGGVYGQETGVGYRQHILYCGTSEDAIQLIEHLVVERNDLAQQMLAPQSSSCHDTMKEQRPPMHARNHEEIFSRYALGHTFTVESATTVSGRVIYVMGATRGE